MPREVWLFLYVLFVAFCLTAFVSCLEWHAGMQHARWDTLSDPFLGDLMEYPGTYLLLHHPGFFCKDAPGSLPVPMFSAVAYPPLATALIAPLYLLGNVMCNFICLAFASLLVGFLFIRRALLERGLPSIVAIFLPLALLVMSFPIQRLVHQGNIELILWIFASTGICAFLNKRDNIAAIFWGLAAAMKLFPILLLILFLPKRRYRAFVIGGLTFFGSTVLALWWLGPSISVAWHGSLQNVFGYQSLRVSEWTLRELVANHSFFGVAKIIAMIMHLPLQRLTPIYYLCGAVVMAWAFFGKLWKMPVTNQLLAVSVFMVMFPPISYYHTLIHLYAPLLLLIFLAIQSAKSKVTVRGLQQTMLLFVPLLVPYTLLTFPSFLMFCGIIQALVLAALFVCALQFPFATEAHAGR